MTIKPKDISLNLMGSIFQNSETETVLRNLLLLMRKENEWKPFTWLDYQDFCTHEVSIGELAVIEALAFGGKPVYNSSVEFGPRWLIFDEKDKSFNFSAELILALHNDFAVSVTLELK